ncbi:hypothetical protein [Flavobacterium akiainvivens]|uniref:hypothetical protein n=1 Tax=Flavobacterium akiainvivens TaxID=1202724 RepID=UPI001364CCEE|nr:hypothetical protein [Flavobacterium akiainvivens]
MMKVAAVMGDIPITSGICISVNHFINTAMLMQITIAVAMREVSFVDFVLDKCNSNDVPINTKHSAASKAMGKGKAFSDLIIWHSANMKYIITTSPSKVTAIPENAINSVYLLLRGDIICN